MPGLARRAATAVVSLLALIPQLAPPVFAEPVSSDAPILPCEQWVVRLKGDFANSFADALSATELAAAIGAEVIASAPRLHAHLFAVCAEDSKAKLLAREDERIALAFPNVPIRPTAASPQQWYLHNVGQPYYVGATASGSAITNAQALSAGFAPSVAGKDIRWDEAQLRFPAMRGNGVTVAVVDSGVDTTLPALAGNIASGGGAIDCELDLVALYPDTSGHGTAVASLIAANGRNGAMTGVAPDAKVLPFQPRCSDNIYGGVFEFASALIYASENAQVINLSNGLNPADFYAYDSPAAVYGQALELYKSVIDDAVARGVIVVASAGNGGNGNEVDLGLQPGDYLFPASFPHVISVGSSRSDGLISASSQWNDRVDVAAPGDRILTLRSSHVLNCGQPGSYSCFVNLDGSGGAGGAYRVYDGTSFSAPLVSGAAALAKQKWPRITADDFEYLVRYTADDAGAAGFDLHFGAGTLNLERMLAYNFPPHLAVASLSSAALRGAEVQVRAQVENLEGDADITSLIADLASIGLTSVKLVNVAPGVFESAPITIPVSTAIGQYTAPVTVRDAAGAVATTNLHIDVVAAVPPPQFSAPNVVGPAASSIAITGPERGRGHATNEERVTLTGTASPDIAFIEVNAQPIQYVAGTTAWTADITLVEGTNELTVRGFDLGRTAEVSDTVTIVLDQDAPKPVRNLEASSGMLSWSAPSGDDVEGYHVYRLDGKKAKRVSTTRKREFRVASAGKYSVVAEDEAGNKLEPTKAATVTTGTSVDSAFVDVAASHFARPAVDALAARGVLQVAPRFRPEAPMTRAEFTKLLVLAAGKSSSNASTGFTDVPTAHSLASYVAVAARASWVRGDGGRFFPDRPISRGEAALMLVRAFKIEASDAQHFGDTSGDVGRAAAALHDLSIVRGVNGRFEPQRSLLRGEAAKMVAASGA
jgi:hypothetical protein